MLGFSSAFALRLALHHPIRIKYTYQADKKIMEIQVCQFKLVYKLACRRSARFLALFVDRSSFVFVLLIHCLMYVVQSSTNSLFNRVDQQNGFLTKQQMDEFGILHYFAASKLCGRIVDGRSGHPSAVHDNSLTTEFDSSCHDTSSDT